jgi:hypothetical protein
MSTTALRRMPVRQLHQHLGAAGLARVQAAGDPVEDLPLVGQPARLLARRAAGIREPGGDVFPALDVGEVLGIGDQGEEHLPPFFAGADDLGLNPVAGFVEAAEVAVDVRHP